MTVCKKKEGLHLLYINNNRIIKCLTIRLYDLFIKYYIWTKNYFYHKCFSFPIFLGL